jgi:4-hydroxy-tetrahydrodipicolinate synthase
MKLLPEGLWPVMLTPFDVQNKVDLKALEKLTEFYIEAGANGLFANCLSSEMFQLSEDERLLVTKTVIKVADGRVPIVATGSFGDNMELSATFFKKLYDLGSDAVIISTSQPCDEFQSEADFRLKIDDLMKRTENIPLGLYECPVPFKRLISAETMKWLAETNRFVYHKDTSCDIDEIKKKIDAVRGTSFGFYNAHIPTAIESIEYGGRGIAPISANLYPELLSHLVKLIGKEDKKEELNKLNLALDMMDTIIHHNYPFTAKVFLEGRGLDINTSCRVSRIKMQAHDYNKIKTIRTVFEQLSEEFGINTIKF